MISEESVKTKAKILKMGVCELMDYKQKIINSLLENSIKFSLYDLIDQRLAALNINGAVVLCDDSDFDIEIIEK